MVMQLIITSSSVFYLYTHMLTLGSGTDDYRAIKPAIRTSQLAVIADERVNQAHSGCSGTSVYAAKVPSNVLPPS